MNIKHKIIALFCFVACVFAVFFAKNVLEENKAYVSQPCDECCF